MPDDQWKRQLYAESWTTGDSYNMAIGQGYVLSTPLQVLNATAAVANGGTLYQPQIVYQVVDAAGGLQRDFTPIVTRELPVDPGVMELVQEGMWATVNADFGTATTARVPGVTVAGKTGTAEFCEYIPELEDCRRDDLCLRRRRGFRSRSPRHPAHSSALLYRSQPACRSPGGHPGSATCRKHSREHSRGRGREYGREQCQ